MGNYRSTLPYALVCTHTYRTGNYCMYKKRRYARGRADRSDPQNRINIQYIFQYDVQYLEGIPPISILSILIEGPKTIFCHALAHGRTAGTLFRYSKYIGCIARHTTDEVLTKDT